MPSNASEWTTEDLLKKVKQSHELEEALDRPSDATLLKLDDATICKIVSEDPDDAVESYNEVLSMRCACEPTAIPSPRLYRATDLMPGCIDGFLVMDYIPGDRLSLVWPTLSVSQLRPAPRGGPRASRPITRNVRCALAAPCPAPPPLQTAAGPRWAAVSPLASRSRRRCSPAAGNHGLVALTDTQPRTLPKPAGPPPGFSPSAPPGVARRRGAAVRPPVAAPASLVFPPTSMYAPAYKTGLRSRRVPSPHRHLPGPPKHLPSMFTTLSILALAAAASAAPATLHTRQSPGPQCAGLGPAAFDTAYNFTLAAWATSGPNANDTGVPLVLGQAGAVDGAEFKVLSTWASFPYNDFPLLTLQAGALTGAGVDGREAEAGAAIAGQALTFVTPPQGAPATVFCAVASTSAAHGGYPLLAADGDTGSFALCPAGTYPSAQTNVVYRPTPDNYGAYLYDECVPVTLQLIGLY